MKTLFTITILLFTLSVRSQSISIKLTDAIKKLETDEQLKYGQLAFYAVEQQTGKVVASINASTGLVAASAQKVITAAAAFNILGSNFKYQTDLSYDGKIEDGVLKGNLYVMGSGDPTLGSSRYEQTTEQFVLNEWITAIKKAGIRKIDGDVICFDKTWETQTLPGGWIWDDIGNYYGAGASAINWSENQYDIFLKSGSKEGDKVSIVSMDTKPLNVTFNNEVTTGKQGTGDTAWIYLPPYCNTGFIRGTIPPNQSVFKISGSFPNPAIQLQTALTNELRSRGITVQHNKQDANSNPILTALHTHYSPSLESVIYWLSRKSINLYAEALLKTIAFQKRGKGSTEVGVEVIKNFWKSKGIDPAPININDGSGLSPLNRVTAESLVKVMQYARTQPWYSMFNEALPEFNNIKMKSGTMTGVKSFTGYLNGYTFAIIANNYSGSSSDITRKMYALLDLLK